MSRPEVVEEATEANEAGAAPAARPVLVVGAAACVACCAPPILGAVGIAVGLSGLAWFAGGLAVAAAVALVGTGLIVRRRRPGAA